MSTKIKNLVIKTGSYMKDGEVKNRYKTIGGLFEAAEGHQFILMDPTVNLAGIDRDEGHDSVLVRLYDPPDSKSKFKEDDLPF